MRCPNCAKFTGFENGEPEIQDENPDLSGTIAETEVRFFRQCNECSDELMEAILTVHHEFSEEIINSHTGEGHELTVSVNNPQEKERHEPPDKPRYKTLFGVMVDFDLTCSCDAGILETTEVESDYVAASEMESLV